MADNRDWSIEQGLRTADQEIAAFRSAVREPSFASVEPLPSLRQQVFRAEIGGVLCILRVVSHVRPAASARRHNAFHRLARMLCPERMSSPAVLTRFAQSHSGVPANTDIVVTEHAPLSYVGSDKMAGGTLRRIGGDARHVGAVLSYVAHLADHQIRQNLLFSTNPDEEFPYWFIDLDFSFGATMSWGYGRPIFFPGRQLNYQAEGEATHLPRHAPELLDWVGKRPRREITKVFGLSALEAVDLQDRCIKLQQLGLAAAIERERFWGPENGWLTRGKERAHAQLAKARIAWRALRS
jgi:hypothetical protein